MPCNATFQRGQQTNTQKSAYSTGFQQSVRCSSSSLSFPLPSFRSLYLNLFLSTCLLCFRKLNPFISCILHRKTLSTPHSDYDLCTASRISTPFSTPNPIFFLFLFFCDMFHVSARPGQQHHYDMYQHQHPAAPLPNLQLPRTLNRPAFTEVQREAILAVEPNLGQVPFEYIRKGLHSRGEEYVQTYRP